MFGRSARPGKPGVYARVADDPLRPRIAHNTGAGREQRHQPGGEAAKARRAKRRAA
jgi:hypothetical protein